MNALKLYDLLSRRPLLRHGILAAMTVAMLLSLTRLSLREDIRDFLPLTETERQAMQDGQEAEGMNLLMILFEGSKTADVVQAMDRFMQAVGERDTAHWCQDMQSSLDLERAEKAMNIAYENIPFLLHEADYQRMDSLLGMPGYIDQRLESDLDALLFPSGDLLEEQIRHDPLGLFLSFEGQEPMPFITISSPFGSSETSRNALLIALLEDAIAATEADFPAVKAHITGAPQVAVGNAKQIKNDSLWAILLASVLIIALLVCAFGSLSDIILIAVSVAWGWLFALAGMAWLHNNVSMIVVGISSIIIGIAVNYPLHLIDHARHTGNIRQALEEVQSPLLVGNITTVGAFLTLVPLKSVALRDLGLFAALLLIGTILFVLVFLPHMLSGRSADSLHLPLNEGGLKAASLPIKGRFRGVFHLPSLRFEAGRKTGIGLLLLTLILGYFSLSTEFDADITHINYMTQQQKQDMMLLDSLRQSSRFSVTQPPEESLKLWQGWLDRHPSLLSDLAEAADRHGFAADAFAPFADIIQGKSLHEPLQKRGETAEGGPDDGLSQQFSPPSEGSGAAFSTMLDALQSDFNYIGLACSAIVFIFLWLSFRRLSLAIIAFIPMVVSWIWILGIMTLLGLKFNIVNIILATFIFGQGDDYTIFMVEGCVAEYEHGRPVLASYTRSIILSALIMFIGIGSLIISRHPALHSLAEVTIIGMACVVVMAYLLPPTLYKWTKKLQ